MSIEDFIHKPKQLDNQDNKNGIPIHADWILGKNWSKTPGKKPNVPFWMKRTGLPSLEGKHKLSGMGRGNSLP